MEFPRTPIQRAKNKRKDLRSLADEDLVALAQGGELRAFELIYERHGRAAYSLAARMVGHGAAAEDVVQEVFLSVWRSLERYDANRAGVRTWLMRIVHSRAIDALRAQSVHTRRRAEQEGFEEEVRSSEPEPDTLALEREDARAVREALETLPDDQRKAIELAYFSGFSQTEIAEIVDAPLGTVKGRMRLGLEKLRDELESGGAVAGGTAG